MPLLPALVVIVGLCIGVSAVWLLGPPAEKPMPDVYVSLQGDTVQIGTMESGWGPSSVRGSALVSDVATLLVPIPDATNRELIVDIEMIGERKSNSPPVRIQLSANETVLGAFDLDATRLQRLLLPASAIDPHAPIIFKFESSATPTEPVLIRSLTLRDIATLQDVARRCRKAGPLLWRPSERMGSGQQRTGAGCRQAQRHADGVYSTANGTT